MVLTVFPKKELFKRVARAEDFLSKGNFKGQDPKPWAIAIEGMKSVWRVEMEDEETGENLSALWSSWIALYEKILEEIIKANA